MKKSKIADFATIQAETEFWDTHDFTEFEDETHPVCLQVRDSLEALIAVQLEPEEREVLDNLARVQGVRPEALVHSWVVEQLRKRE